MDESTARYDEAGGGDFNIEEEVEASTHMSLKKITLLREILVTQVNSLALFPLAAAILCIGWKCTSGMEFLWLLTGFIPLAFYLFRIKINNFIVLLISHFAVILAVRFLFLNAEGRSFYVLAAVAYAVYSIIVRMKSADFQDSRLPTTIAGGIAVLALVFLRYVLENNYFEMKIILTFIVSFGLSLLVTYLESYINFLIVNRSSTGHIPAREMFFSGSFMAVVCVLFMMALLLLTSGIGWFQVVVKGIRFITAAVLKFVLSIAGNETGEIYVDDTHIEGAGLPDIYEAEEPALIWQILMMLAVIALAAVIVYLLFCLIKKLFYFIRERMEYKGLESGSENLSSVKDVREKCRISGNGNKNEGFSLKGMIRLSPGEKIRRLYKKHVLKCGGLTIRSDNKELQELDLKKPELMTAGEWGRVLDKPVMSEIYDKARYSDSECTSEDYRLMRQTVNNQNHKNTAAVTIQPDRKYK